jgi:uncharacterized protein (DUF1800 family)
MIRRTAPLDRAGAAHLFRRAAFAPAPGDVDRAVRQGLDATVDELLAPAAPAATEIERTIRAQEDRAQIAGAVLHRLVTSAAPVRETIALFFHNHFVSAFSKVRDAGMMLDQLALFRSLGLGGFGALTKAVTRDPAMVRYLDLERSNRSQPNENFARELMELFTTGPGPYSERDVKEAARAFTGHHLRNGRFNFSEPAHDPTQKTVLGLSGPLRGDDVVDVLAGHPATARFLAQKLARQFVSDDPAEEAVGGLERSWRRSGGDLREVLAALFRSDIFYSPAARFAVTRSPAALVAATSRLLGAALAPVAAAKHAFAMGQPLLDPPTVKGWPGGTRWLNAATLLARRTFLLEAVAEARRTQSLPAPLANAREGADAACEVLFGEKIDRSGFEPGCELEVLICHPRMQRC